MLKNFELTQISSCDRSWDFKPLFCPSLVLPACALDNYLLNGFNLPAEHPVQNVKPAATFPEEILKALYPKLTWPELTRFLARPGTKEYFNPEKLMSVFGFGWDEHWQKLSALLLQWPLEIQNYCSEKEIRPFDLSPVSTLSTEQQISLLSKLVSLNVSKSVFCQLLEISSELLLMGQENETLSLLTKPHPLEELKKVRFPQTTARDLGFKNKVKSWIWPRGVHAQASRQGDNLGIEFRFFAKSPEELQKTLKSLESHTDQWKTLENESYKSF